MRVRRAVDLREPAPVRTGRRSRRLSPVPGERPGDGGGPWVRPDLRPHRSRHVSERPSGGDHRPRPVRRQARGGVEAGTLPWRPDRGRQALRPDGTVPRLLRREGRPAADAGKQDGPGPRRARHGRLLPDDPRGRRAGDLIPQHVSLGRGARGRSGPVRRPHGGRRPGPARRTSRRRPEGRDGQAHRSGAAGQV